MSGFLSSAAATCSHTTYVHHWTSILRLFLYSVHMRPVATDSVKRSSKVLSRCFRFGNNDGSRSHFNLCTVTTSPSLSLSRSVASLKSAKKFLMECFGRCHQVLNEVMHYTLTLSFLWPVSKVSCVRVCPFRLLFCIILSQHQILSALIIAELLLDLSFILNNE
jgi:hypothetical protein